MLILASCSSNSATPSSTTASTGTSGGGKAPITIALVTSLTGPGADQFLPGPDAFTARIAEQNAMGGVNGHMIKGIIIDDQTTQPTVAIQDALSKGAFGIVAESPLFFIGAKIPQQQGVPVTGGSVDGPEWGEQPYTNMFAADTGSVDPAQPASTLPGKFMKQHGGSILGAYGYPIGGTSKVGAVNASKSFEHAGGSTGVLNTTVPIGSVDFTGDAIVAKQKHVNAVYPDMGNESNNALVTAFQQEGVNPKVTLLPTGYQQSAVSSPAWHSLQGTYFASMFRPFSAPNAGTQAMDSAMEKYAHFTKNQFPTFAEYEAWVGADLMIQGLKLAGSDPTRGECHQGSAGHHVLRRERDRSDTYQLFDGIRAFGVAGLQVVPTGADLRIQTRLADSRMRNVDDRELSVTGFADVQRLPGRVPTTSAIPSGVG